MGVIVTAFFQFTACYQTASGKISDICGTYQLTRKTYGQDSSGSAIDILERDKIVEYLVIKEDGTGFRVYGDNENELACTELRVSFIEDTDNPGKYQFIEYRTDPLGNGTTKLGYLSTEKQLNYGTPKISSGCIHIESSSIQYKKVSDKQDLSYVQTKVGKTLDYIPYDLQHITGKHSGTSYYEHYDEETQENLTVDSEYLYFFADFNNVSQTVDLRYRLKTAEEEVVKSNLPFTYTTAKSKDGNYEYVYIDVDGFRFRSYITGGMTRLVEIDGVEYLHNFFEYTYTTADEIIRQAIEDYAVSSVKGTFVVKAKYNYYETKDSEPVEKDSDYIYFVVVFDGKERKVDVYSSTKKSGKPAEIRNSYFYPTFEKTEDGKILSFNFKVSDFSVSVSADGNLTVTFGKGDSLSVYETTVYLGEKDIESLLEELRNEYNAAQNA